MEEGTEADVVKEGRDLEVDHDLRALAARRWRIALALTGTMMATYFGFLFIVAYAKPFAGSLVSPGLSWGILLGALVIVVAWIVTGVYVAWANSTYDAELAKLRERHDREQGTRKAEDR